MPHLLLRLSTVSVYATLTLFCLGFNISAHAANDIGLAIEADGIGRELTLTYKLKNLDDPMNIDTIKNVSIVQDLDAAFGAGTYQVSSSPILISGPDTTRLTENFDGSGNTELIMAGNLASGDSLVIKVGIQISVLSDQGMGLGIYSIQATAQGDLLMGGSVSDLSTTGSNPDPNGNGDAGEVGEDIPTIHDALEAQPRIGVAKHAVVHNDTIDFELYIRNFSNRDFVDVSIPDNLDSVFGVGNYAITTVPSIAGGGSLVANTSFNGSSDDQLISSGVLSADTEVVLGFSVKLTNPVDRGLGVGTYENQVRAIATTATGKVAEDLSDMGKDPGGSRNDDVRNPEVDKPTRFEMSTNTVVVNPVIGVSHTATVNGDFVTLDYYIENLGDVQLTNVLLEQDLDVVFGAGKYIITTPPSIVAGPGTITTEKDFDGSQQLLLLENDTLEVGATAQVQLVVEVDEVTDQGSGLGIYNSQAYAAGEGPQFGYTDDLSDNGTNPDPNDNDDPTESGEDDVTPIAVTPRPAIGIAKDMYVDGFTGSFPIIAIEFYIENLGNVPLSNVSLLDNLNDVFGVGNYTAFGGFTTIVNDGDFEATSLTFNNAYNGNTNTTVISGGSLAVNGRATILVKGFLSMLTDEGNGFGIYRNQATITATDPLMNTVIDLSDSGVVVDANNNGTANEAGENDATILDANVDRQIGVALDASVASDVITFDMYIENLGNEDLFGLSVVHDLDDVLGEGNYTIISPPTFVNTPGTLIINPDFSGNLDDAKMFSANSNLTGGSVARITYQVRVDKVTNQGLGLGSYSSQITLRALPDRGQQISDLSDFGTDPDPNGNANPNESGENDATTFQLSPQPIVGVALDAAVLDTIVTYDIYLENLGGVVAEEILLVDNLDEVFGEGNYVIETAPSLVVDPGTLILNSNFDGSDSTGILSISSSLAAGAEAQIQFAIKIINIEDQGQGAGIYSNQVEVSNATNFSTRVSDLSDDGTDPDPNGNNEPGEAGEDDSTTISLSGGAIGAALNAIVAGSVVTLEFTIENIGRYPLSNIIVRLPLNPVFVSGNYSVTMQPTLVSGPSTLNTSFQFFGFSPLDNVVGGGTLDAGEKVVIRAKVNISNVINGGVYTVGYTVNATDPAGNSLSDVSDAGVEVDANNNNDAGDTGEGDVTTIRIGDEANIGGALTASVAGDTVTFDYYIENFGDFVLSNIQLEDNLDEVFGAGNYTVITPPYLVSDPGTITPEMGYNGSDNSNIIATGSTLAAKDSARFRSTVIVNTTTDMGIGLGRYQNQFEVLAQAPMGTIAQDLSDDGIDPDPDGNGRSNDAGEDDVTFFTIDSESLGLALDASVECNVVTFKYVIQNFGTTPWAEVRVAHNLDGVFGAGNYTIVEPARFAVAERALEISDTYNGAINDTIARGRLGAGVTEIIELKVRVDTIVVTGLYNTQAVLVSESLMDLSGAGLMPDKDNDLVPNEALDNDMTTFTVEVLPIPMVGSNSPVCLGQPINLMDAGDATSWVWLKPDGDTLSLLQNPSITAASMTDAGTYQLIVFDDNGCSDSTTISVGINTLPTVSIPSVSPVCLGDTIKISETGGSGVNWNWSSPNSSFSSTLQAPDIANSMKVDSGTYKVIVTDINGCIDSLTTEVVVNDLPEVSIPSISPLCLGDTIKLSETGGEAVSWMWSGPNGSFSSTDEMPSIDNSVKIDSGTYQVIVTDVNGCIDSVTAEVVIHDLPEVVIPIVSPLCLRDTIKLTETGGDGVSWLWSGPNGSYSSTDQMPSIANSVKIDSGTYQVIVTDVNGCIDSVTAEVVVHDLPEVSIPIVSPLCLGDTIKLSETGGDGVSWLWSGPNGSFSSTEEMPSIANSVKIDSGTYQVIVTDVNGCRDSLTTEVVVNDLPEVSISSISPLCLGDTIKLSETGGEAMSWMWSGPNGSFSSTDQMPTIHNSVKIDSGTYQVIVTDVNGCIDSVTAEVVIHDLPEVVIPIVSPLCLGDTIKLSETGGDGVSWLWSGPNGSYSSTDQMPSIANSVKIDSGTYQVIVTDVNGCIDSVTAEVVVHYLPEVSIPIVSPLCLGDTIKLSETGGDGVSWLWSGPNGSFSSTEEMPSIANSVKIDSGTYQVIVTDVNGCIDSLTTEVVVNDLPEVVIPSISPVCLGDTIKLSETGGETLSWLWNSPKGSYSSTDQMPSIPNSMKVDSGTYQVIVTDVNGCVDSVSTEVIVNSLPEVTATSNSAVCQGETIKLMASGSTNVTWDWSGEASFGATVQNPMISNASIGAQGMYQVEVTDQNGCMAADTVMVVVHALPTVTIDASAEVCLGDSVLLTETAGDAITWSWTGPNNSFAAMMQSAMIPLSSKADSGTYKVVVSDANGCIDSMTTDIIVHDLPTVVIDVNNGLCEGTNLQLEEDGGDAIMWEWSGPDGYMTTSQNPTITQVDKDDIGRYYVSVSDANGCEQQDSVDVMVDLIPIILSDIIGPREICEDVEDISYTLADVDNADTYSWTYTQASTLDQDGGNTATVSNAIPGGALSVVAANSCGSSDPVSIDITTASDAVCGLVTCFRENAFVDSELASILGNQLLIQVSEVITSNMVLPIGGGAQFIAGESVDLFPGLQIAQQAVFTVEIASCDLVPALIESIQKKD